MNKSMKQSLVHPIDQLHDYLLVGATGVGKTPVVRALVTEELIALTPVAILDYGRTYAGYCSIVGGTYMTLKDSGEVSVEPYGDAAVFVVEFGALQGQWQGDLPGVDDVIRRGGLLVVDDTVHVYERYPALVSLVTRHAANGGRYCVTGQMLEDVRPFSHLSARARLLTLSPVQHEHFNG